MRISDWSSDVCSSDLGLPPQQIICRAFLAAPPSAARTAPMSASPNVDPAFTRRLYGRRQGHALRQGQATLVEEIGRASCRARVCQYGVISVVDVSLKKNKSYKTINNNKRDNRH